MLRTGFLNYRRSYMTTLRTRWEKPDYTGVIAEVPLGHYPSPKKSLNHPHSHFYLFSRVTAAFGRSTPRLLERSKLVNLQVFLERAPLPTEDAAVRKLASCPAPFGTKLYLAFWRRARFNLYQAGIKRSSAADVGKRF